MTQTRQTPPAEKDSLPAKRIIKAKKPFDPTENTVISRKKKSVSHKIRKPYATRATREDDTNNRVRRSLFAWENDHSDDGYTHEENYVPIFDFNQEKQILQESLRDPNKTISTTHDDLDKTISTTYDDLDKTLSSTYDDEDALPESPQIGFVEEIDETSGEINPPQQNSSFTILKEIVKEQLAKLHADTLPNKLGYKLTRAVNYTLNPDYFMRPNRELLEAEDSLRLTLANKKS